MARHQTQILQTHISLFVAVAIICLCLSPNRMTGWRVDGENTRQKLSDIVVMNENGNVLTKDDETLYRSIFVSQSQGLWKQADLMIAKLQDQRLMGHVLADRYQRRSATRTELQSWLAIYSDLPEADELYATAKKLPGGKNASLTGPQAINKIQGQYISYGGGSAFRSTAINYAKLSLKAQHEVSRIETALKSGGLSTGRNLLDLAGVLGTLPSGVLAALTARLAGGYFYSGHAAEARQLTGERQLRHQPGALWINGLSHYKLGDYAAAAASFKSLANRDDLPQNDRTAAAFWAYRSLARSDDKADADQWLAMASHNPGNFYGLLAGNLMGQNAEAAWSGHTPAFDKVTAGILASHPVGARAVALAQVGRSDLAEKELSHLNPKGHYELQQAMLSLAEKEHMAALALRLGAMAHHKASEAANLYPLPSWHPKNGFRVEQALIYALVRHESRFDARAVSKQGACGLMQLMPSTAESMNGAKLRNERDGICPSQLFDPVINIGLGQNYVRYLAGQPMIGDNLLLLLAAYNGGPGRLSQRGGLSDADDPLLFIESLPSKETHDYVQQVLIQYWAYRSRLNQSLKSLDQLAHGEWPRYILKNTNPVREALLGSAATKFAVASK